MALINNPAVSMLISDDVTKFIFDEIVKHRSILFKELTASLSSKLQQEGHSGVPTSAAEGSELKSQVEAVVSRLKEADLIEVNSTPITDFNSYYVTSNGLNTEKQLRVSGIGQV